MSGWAVYVLRGLRSGLLKIGRSQNVDRRAREIASYYEPVELIAAFIAPPVTENLLHRRFASSLDRSRGREWFRDDGAIRAWIETLPAESRGSVVFRIKHRRPSYRPQPTREDRAAKWAKVRADYETEHGHPITAMRVPGCAVCARKAARYAKWLASHPPKERPPQPIDALLRPRASTARVA